MYYLVNFTDLVQNESMNIYWRLLWVNNEYIEGEETLVHSLMGKIKHTYL
jgi:hypothetical protein